MDRDQEKYYPEDYDLEENAQDNDAPEEINDMKYFIELLKYMRTVIEEGANVPLTNKKIINADICLKIIDDMEQNLPDAVQFGSQLYNEENRILVTAEQKAANMVSSAEMRATATLDKAKDEAEQQLTDAENEADAIIADAKERAAHLVSESVVLEEAREEARILKSEARVEANEVRLQAIHDAKVLLNDVENQLAEALASVRRRRSELDSKEEERL